MTLGKAELSVRLEAAKVAARMAGDVLLKHYVSRDLLHIEEKGRNDFVSNADREAEEIIMGFLRCQFPSDVFLGEESGLSGGAETGPTWCIDPLDGTSNFLKGAHNWCISLGIFDSGEPVLGVILDPLRDEMFSALAGGGAYCNGQHIRVSSVADPGSATVGLGHVPRVPVDTFCEEMATILDAGFSFRQVGAGALVLAYVAAGRVDAYYEKHMWPWDAVAGLALIGEAGGKFRRYGGENIQAGDMVLATTDDLYKVLEARLLALSD